MSDEKFEVVVFKSKTFGKLLEEVHSNSRNNDKLILGLIEDLKEYIESLGDAIQLAPIISSYVKLAIDNNEHIIKIANIVQKSLERVKTSNTDDLSEFTLEDKEELNKLMLEWEGSLKLPDSNKTKGLLTDKIPVKTSVKKN